MNVALIGSVSSSWHALRGLLHGRVEVTGVLGVAESEAARISDYRVLRPLSDEHGVPFQSFIKVKEPQVEEFLRGHAPDLLFVIGLSQLVPRHVIDIARVGGVGFHPTPLPEGRGRAPVAWTILRGARAAANLFFLTEEADAGDIIVQREVPVLPDDYSEDLIARTNAVLEEAIIELAPRIRAGDIPRTPQDHSKATYYPKRTPADGRIDWSQSTEQVYRLVRAAGRPYPGAFTNGQGHKLVCWRGRPEHRPAGHCEPGTVLDVDTGSGVLIATRDGAIRLTEVTVEPATPWSALLAIGDRLA